MTVNLSLVGVGVGRLRVSVGKLWWVGVGRLENAVGLRRIGVGRKGVSVTLDLVGRSKPVAEGDGPAFSVENGVSNVDEPQPC